MTGTVFDIQEFTVHDGPGTRVTIFLKGCSLRCKWCHNPEGLRPDSQLMVKISQCIHCGLCKQVCHHEECKPYDRCLHSCPKGLISLSGKKWDAEELAKHLNSYEPFFSDGGGVTFSGGEPLLQFDFLNAVCSKLIVHKAIQTSGYADNEIFKRVLEVVDYVLFDIKIADREKHKEYTGVYNDMILQNYKTLAESGKPHVVRIPLIPNITDTGENLEAIFQIVGNDNVELMKYNPFAAAKYEMIGMEFPLKI